MRKFLIFIFILGASPVGADVTFNEALEGDFYTYIPARKPKNILVIAHGMLSDDDVAADVARSYLTRWTRYADEYGLLLIAPVFDTPRFGNLEGGYGGYRNLFGKHVSADTFVNELVNRYSSQTDSGSQRFFLYGHSAGGQFVNRYVVTHPERIIKAVVSAAGRYSYPTKLTEWPYGAGSLTKALKWKDGSREKINVTKSLRNYALAASKVSIVIGSEDTREQPKRPAHLGKNRIEIAHSWAQKMNQNAKRWGVEGRVSVRVVPSVGHSSSKLTQVCAEVMFSK